MQIDLSGRTAVVTGAGRGIGRATALELARLGANVVVNDIGTASDGSGRDEGPARGVATEIEARGGAATYSIASVVDYTGAEAIVGTAVEHFGGVDILVNNAGLSAGGPIWEIEPDLFSKVCFSHLLGTFNCTRCAAPLMKERGWGRIINLVSRAGLVGIAGNAAYGAGKGGVFGLTNVASRDLQPFGVTVNAVNPAATDTRMVTEAIDEIRSRSDERSEKMAASLLAALQKPESVAAVIAALCSPQADHVTGEILYVAGSEVGVFDPLSVGQSQSREAGWSSEQLAEALADFELHPLDGPY